MSDCPRIPVGVGPPVNFSIALTFDPTEVDATTVTGASMAVRKPDGTVVSWSATFTTASSAAVTAAIAGTPPILTVANTSTFVDNPSVTVAGVGGMTGVTGPFYVSVLTPTTIALYLDAALSQPATGAGTYTSGGTVTPNAIGTVVHDFGTTSSSSPQGDLDQIGLYSVATTLSVPGGTWPCKPAPLLAVSPFAPEDL